MKNILILIAIVSTFLYSCSSDNVIDNGEDTSLSKDLYRATFSLKNVTSKSGDLAFRNTTLQDFGIKHLEYWVYKNSDLTEMYVTADPVLSQLVEEGNFNDNINIELPAGDYSIFFYATDTVVGKQDPRKIAPAGVKNQMFSGEKSFILNESNSVISETISLDRLVGKVELVIQDLDQLPSEVQSITPFISGFTRIMVTPTMPVKPIYINVLRHYVSFDSGNEFQPISRNEFSLHNEENPIAIYTLPSDWYAPGGTSSLFTENLYIQGSKDAKFHRLNMEESLLDQNPAVSFVRKIGKYAASVNKVVRYTGKIGSMNNENGIEFTFNDKWDEVYYEVEK